jgi:hypothetical protein
MGTFTFNLLTEPAIYTTTTLPSGFNANIAWLLGQCCAITYQDYDQNSPPDFSGLTLGAGVTISANFSQGFTASEANGPGSTPLTDPGDYSSFPAGFGVVLSITNPPTGVPSQLIVIALRGTRTWDEWFQDTEAYPALFAGDEFPTLALVHTGFYGLYTVGSLGATAQDPLNRNPANRASGAIAQQVATFFANTANVPPGLPVYVTGHSLGGALAAYCAYDIQAILNYTTSISMYSLAAPRCVMGANIQLGSSGSIGIPVATFLQYYQQAVPNSFRIVHTCDVVPILPPSTILNSDTLQLFSAHVTDAWSYLGSSGGLTQNVVAFAAQTGDLGNNHSCLFTYLPYLIALAGGFS